MPFWAGHPAVDTSRDALARFTDYGASSLDILVRCFTVETDWSRYMQVRHDILLGIGEIVMKEGAEFAFPTQTVDVPKSMKVQFNS